MDHSKSQRLVHVLNNFERPGQYKTNSKKMSCVLNYCFKFLIDIRENQELSGVESVTSGYYILVIPLIHIPQGILYIYIYIYIYIYE